MNKNSWNPVLNLVRRIGDDMCYKMHCRDYPYNISFETWIQELNVEEYNEFAKNVRFDQYNEFLLIRYDQFGADDMYVNKDSIYRECRSVVIDLKRMELALTPFRKFFNLNEVDENSLENICKEIEDASLVEFSNKLDGSMVQARLCHSYLVVSSSKRINPELSFRIADTKKVILANKNYWDMLMQHPNCTFIFEFIYKEDSHIVEYNKEGLYLVGIRNVVTGIQFPYHLVLSIAKQYGIPTTTMETITLEEALSKSKVLPAKSKEGWVIDIRLKSGDNHMVKLKTDEYSCISRLVIGLGSSNLILKLIADDMYDDVIAKVPYVHRGRINDIASKIKAYVVNNNAILNEYWLANKNKPLKEFMIFASSVEQKAIRTALKNKYLNKEVNFLKYGSPNCPRYTKSSLILGDDATDPEIDDD